MKNLSNIVNPKSLSEYPDDYSFNGIDLTKFLCSILVVIIHIPLFTPDSFEYADYIKVFTAQYICRIAVPFYFVTAGFLLFRKIDIKNIDVTRIKNYCFKLLKLLGLWTVLLSCSDTVHLWYFGAIVVAVVLLSLLLYFKVDLKYIILLSLLFYFIGLAGDSHSYISEQLRNIDVVLYIIKIYREIFGITRNGVFMGFIFVLMGALFAHKKIVINFKVAVLGFISSMLLLFVEVYVLEYCNKPIEHNMYIFLLPVVFFLFYIVTHINLKDRNIYKKLRVMGVLIFCSHLLINRFVALLLSVLIEVVDFDFTTVTFVFTMISTLLLSYAIEKLSHKEKFKWLTLLYT